MPYPKVFVTQSEVKIEVNSLLNKLKFEPADLRRQLENRGISESLIQVILSNPAAIRYYIGKLNLKPNRSLNKND